jgi:hypothetical protein
VVDLQVSMQAAIGVHESAVGLGANSFPTLPTSLNPKWERQPTGAARFSTFSTFPTLERVRHWKMLSGTHQIGVPSGSACRDGTRPRDLILKVGEVGKVGNPCCGRVCSFHLEAQKVGKVGIVFPAIGTDSRVAEWCADLGSWLTPGISTWLSVLRGARVREAALAANHLGGAP